MQYSRRPRLVFLFALVLLWAALGAAWAAGSAELLANGGFESLDATGGAENWATRNFGTESKYAAATIVSGAKFGQRCLKLMGTSYPISFGSFSHPAELGDTPSAELLVTIFYRTEGSPQADLAVTTFAEDFTAKEWDTPALTSEAVPLESSNGWRSLSWRVQTLPAARQAIVTLKIHGSGALYVDGVSLKARPAEVQCEVLSPSCVLSPRGARQCCVRLTNKTDKPLPVTVQLDAAAPRSAPTGACLKATLPPDKPQTMNLNYSFPVDIPAAVAVTVLGTQPGQIYDYVSLQAPGLLEGRVVRPAFRAALLPSISGGEVLVRGHVNAAADLCGKLKLQAKLLGLGVTSPEFTADAHGDFECTLPAATLLAGTYAVEVVALQNGAPVGKLELPLLKPANKPTEVGYDEHMRAWLNGKPWLPLGLYYAVDETDFAAAVDAGFNTLVLPSRLASSRAIEACDKLGLATLISSASMEQEFWKNITTKFAQTPGVAGWYVLQKPASQAPPVHPSLLADLYGRLRDLDPRHPICMGLDSMSRLEPYAAWADVIMPWTEPEPVGDLRSVDAMLQRAIKVADGQKPVWPVIQLTGAAWSQDIRLDPAGNGRPPTPEEYRCMAYLAFARGANGLFAYAYRVPQSRHQREFDVQRDAPELWQMVRRVGAELKALTPVLLQGEALAVECPDSSVAMRGYRYNGVNYVLAVNPTNQTVPVGFKVPGLAGNELEVAFDTRKVVGPGNGQFGDQLEPHAVRMYMARQAP